MQHPKIALTLIAAAVALIGCGEQKPAAKADTAIEVKIGHVGPITDANQRSQLAYASASAQVIGAWVRVRYCIGAMSPG